MSRVRVVFDARGEVVNYSLRWGDTQAARVWKAVHLSGGNLDVCRALLRGERVAVDRLDPAEVARYGRRS